MIFSPLSQFYPIIEWYSEHTPVSYFLPKFKSWQVTTARCSLASQTALISPVGNWLYFRASSPTSHHSITPLVGGQAASTNLKCKFLHGTVWTWERCMNHVHNSLASDVALIHFTYTSGYHLFTFDCSKCWQHKSYSCYNHPDHSCGWAWGRFKDPTPHGFNKMLINNIKEGKHTKQSIKLKWP